MHVSGHPARDELAEMYRWVKPAIAVPVHGELRHLRAHVALAESCQVRQSRPGGERLDAAPGPRPARGDRRRWRAAGSGSTAPQLTAMGGPALKSRQRMAHNGDGGGDDHPGRRRPPAGRAAADLAWPGAPSARTRRRRSSRPAAAARQALAALAARPSAATIRRCEEVVRIAVRRSLNARHGKKPVTDVHLVRLPASPSLQPGMPISAGRR